MGLDMYLTKKTSVRNWEFTDEKERHAVSVKKGGKLVKHIQAERVSKIVEDVGYWRKANAIHGWFVDNVQDGTDDCGTYSVSRESLKELLGLVNEVLEASKLVKGKVLNGMTIKDGKKTPIMEEGEYIENPSVAKKLLPVRGGFFFGQYDEETAYNQWYYQSLEETAKILQEALADEEGYYYYHSSW